MSLSNFFSKKQEEKPQEEQQLAPTILVVDDDQLFRTYYQDLLSKTGYKVLLAANGQEGLTIALQNNPNLIILDIIMPGMNGKEVLVKLRSNKTTEKTPVIMLTSEASVKTMDEVSVFSVSKFLNKNTIQSQQIIDAVHESLAFKKT